LLDRPITLATLSLPTTLMAVGGSYLFHVLNQHRLSMAALESQTDRAGRNAAWVDGMNFINPAVLVSGTMTMAGFGALASSSVPAVRDMGLFSTLGVAMVLVLTLAFVPAMLALLPPQTTTSTEASESNYAVWLNGWLRQITALILFRRRTVLILTLAITLGIGVGVVWLRINTDYLKIFPRKSEVVAATEKLHERLSGAASIEIVVSGAPGAIKQLDTIRCVDALEAFALAQPGVDAAISIVDPLKQLYGALAKSGPTSGALPPDEQQLRQLFDDYLSQESALYRLVSRDYSHTIILLRTNIFSSNELRDLTRNLEAWTRANLPAGITAQPTGSVILLNTASDGVADSLLSSLAIALVSIYLMMVILFRSFVTGLLALLPNLLPIVCYFGVLGWTSTALDITTSLVASAVLGLAVDNAVHMIRRYRQCAALRGESPEDEGWVMWMTMLRTGKPMVLANLMLIAAFLLFVLSSFVPVRVAGMLWAVTILACLAADLIFLPVLMKSKPFRRAALPDRGTPAPSSEPVDANIEQAVR
jgi:predicted RND superfamily exporter protein